MEVRLWLTAFQSRESTTARTPQLICKAILHSNLRHSAHFFRLSECSGQSRLCFGCKLKLQQDIHTQLKHAAAPCFLSQVLRSIPKICVISFCNCPRPLVTQAPCMLFNVQPTSSCRQPCHIGHPRRYDCNP